MIDSTNMRIFVGVGAVVFRGSDVLIIKRGKPPFEGRWSIPGGKLHHGEALADAACREVMEETGIAVRIIGPIGVFEALPGEMEGALTDHTLMIDYAAEWLSGEPVAGDDAAAAEFVPFEEALRRISWDKTRDALARALDLRKSAAKPL